MRLTKLCIIDTQEKVKPKRHEQRLLRNMGAHTVVLELLQIPYEKVKGINIRFTSPYVTLTWLC